MNIFSLHSYAFRVAFGAAMISAAVASAGTLTVKFGSAMEVIEGGVTNTYVKGATFVPTAIPCIYKMRMGGLAAGERTFDIMGNDQIHGSNHYRFPQYGDDGWVRVALNPYPSSDTTVELTAHKVSKVYYVDEKNGKDSYDGTADADHIDDANGKGPKATLQSAHDAAQAGSATKGFPVVYVAPGFYTNGSTVATYTPNDTSKPPSSSRRRLVATKNIAFIATDGPEKTFIVGEPDKESSDNFGENAVGGVYMYTQSNSAYLQGFTITGCYSPAAQTGLGHYGTGFCSSTYRVSCLDCIISNNHAKTYYPAASYGNYYRVKFIENKSPSYVNYYGTFISCIFAGNRVTRANNTDNASALHTQAYSYFCTYDLGDADYPQGRRRLNSSSGNSINAALIYKLINPAEEQYASWNCSQVIDNPLFANASSRDYRLGILSPALDAYSYENDLNGAMRRVMTSDIDGRMPVLHDGKMRLGAVWNDPALPVTVIEAVGGGVSVSGVGTGTNVVTSASEITLTATDASKRPFAGFEVNGEMIASVDGKYSFTPSVADGAVTSIKAIYTNVWYVAQEGGNDANNGGLPNQAKATLRAATTNAVSGDIIYVAPGTYGELEGARKYNDEATSLCRVIIPEGVTVESTGGAGNTFIVGAPTAGDVANGNGNGPGAVRCVYAHNRAVLRGFTLTGGHTAADKAFDDYDTYGAALLTGKNDWVYIHDCIISNNYSHYATIFRSNVSRCLIVDNTGGTSSGTTCDAPAGSGCAYINCIIDGNKGNGTVAHMSRAESCTFGKNLLHNDGSAQMLFRSSGSHRVLNSLFTYKYDRWYGTVCATNCIFASGASDNLSPENCENCKFSQSATKINVDADFRPKAGSIAIDTGDETYATYDYGAEKDIYGTPRTLNGKFDIGAVEYDWRPVFAAGIGRRITLTDVSPSVTTNAVAGILIPSGVVAGTVPTKGFYDFTFDVSGGTLEAAIGDEIVGTYADGTHTVRMNVLDPAAEFRFRFVPDAESPGMAIFKSVVPIRGLVLSVR